VVLGRVSIIDMLNMLGLADPKLEARLAQFGSTPLVLSPSDFGKLVAAETESGAK